MSAIYKQEADLENDIMSLFSVYESEVAVKILSEKGLHLIGHLEPVTNDDGEVLRKLGISYAFQQASIPPYGRTDIVIVTRVLNAKVHHYFIDIIELKNESLTLANIGQIARYNVGTVEVIKIIKSLHYAYCLSIGDYIEECSFETHIHLHLIGTSYNEIESSDAKYIAIALQNLSVYSFFINPVSGINFSRMSTKASTQVPTDLPHKLQKALHQGLFGGIKRQRDFFNSLPF